MARSRRWNNVRFNPAFGPGPFGPVYPFRPGPPYATGHLLEEDTQEDSKQSGDEGDAKKRPRPKVRAPEQIREGDLWHLRLLVRTGSLLKFLAYRVESSVVGLLNLTVDVFAEMKPTEIVRYAQRYLAAVEKKSRVIPERCSTNSAMLGEALGLSEVEKQILAFAAAVDTVTHLKSGIDIDPPDALQSYCEAVAAATGQEVESVRTALAPGGKLIEKRLAAVLTAQQMNDDLPVGLMNGLEQILSSEIETVDQILVHFFRPAPEPLIGVEDMAHIREEIQLLKRILGPAAKKGVKGMNVLIHGPTGTGKTQLVRMIARELGLELYEVSDGLANGAPIEGQARFGAYSICQSMLASNRTALVLFDEAEDVFPKSPRFPFYDIESSLPPPGKSWINRSLENSPVPTVWVVNQTNTIDPAFLRRFAYVINLERPPSSIRRRLVGSILGRFGLSEKTIAGLAFDDRWSPGHLESVALALDMAAPESSEEADALATRLLDANLALAGVKSQGPVLNDGPEYDLTLINADVDLEKVIEGLGRIGRGGVCLHGVPGTGKTAFAHYLAKRIERPLMLRRASDLLGCYVGQTEASIAQMFRSASAEGAVLLLDEAEGLLRDRSTAHQRWELTQVNEILSQMEAFEGIFICSTNLVGELDQASLRRFALKIRIDPPKREARWRLFLASLTALGLEPPGPGEEEEIRRMVDRMEGLTPGDATAAIRKARLIGPVGDAWGLASALEGELCGKHKPSSRSVGFRAAEDFARGGSSE